MAIQKATLGVVDMSACAVRDETGDTVGGTTLAQCVAVARAHGVKVALHVGSGVVSPFYVAIQLQAGRGVVVQGNTSALVGTRFQSTNGPVNHAVYVNEARGGTLGEPNEVLVYDTAADHRRPEIDQGPTWWPYSRLRKFAAALRPWGDRDSRTLGPGKFYCAIFPDTEPHAHLRWGGTRTSPLPDRTRVDAAHVWSHSSPHYGKANRKRQLARNDLFTSYQRTTRSGRLWLGDHDGREWVPAKRMRNLGGQR